MDAAFVKRFRRDDPKSGTEEVRPVNLDVAIKEDKVSIGKVKRIANKLRSKVEGLVIKLKNEFQSFNTAPTNASLDTLCTVVNDTTTMEAINLQSAEEADCPSFNPSFNPSFTPSALQTPLQAATAVIYPLLHDHGQVDDMLQAARQPHLSSPHAAIATPESNYKLSESYGRAEVSRDNSVSGDIGAPEDIIVSGDNNGVLRDINVAGDIKVSRDTEDVNRGQFGLNGEHKGNKSTTPRTPQ